MIVAVDGRLANEPQPAGVGNYCAELLRAWPKAGGGLPLRIYLDAPPLASFPQIPEAETCVLAQGRGWMNRVLSAELRRNPPTLFFCPAMQVPAGCPCPAVAVVHDVAFKTFPQYFTFRQRLRARVQAWHALRHAARLMADSEATKSDVTRHYGIAPDRITVALLGCSPRFRPRDETAMAAVRQTYALPERFVLYVGRLQPRKNLPRLIEAFAAVSARNPELPHHLVIAGDKGWLHDTVYTAAKESPARGRVHFLGFVEAADLSALMSAADTVALVSLWEGFGLPVIEAMACGTAVLTSDCSSLPEVAGETAVQVDPCDVEAIATGLERLLCDDAYRADLAARGPAHAATFTWERTARITADALWRVATGDSEG